MLNTTSRRSFHDSVILSFSVLLFSVMIFTGCSGDKAETSDPKTGEANGGKTVVEATGDTAVLTGEAAAFETEGEKVAPETTFSLKLTPHEGDVFQYRMTQKSNTEFDVIKASEQVVYNFTLKVSNVNSDGSIALQMRYDSVRFRRAIPPGPLDSAGKTYTYDTRQPVDSAVPGAAQFKALVGQNVNITVSNEGLIREISNLEPIVNRLLGNLRDSVPPQAIEQFRAGIKVQAYAAVLQQLFLQNPPDSAMKVGQKWTATDSVPLLGVPSRSTVNYEFIEARKVDEKALGRISVKLVTDFPTKTINNERVSATVKSADVHGNGELLFNLDNGMPVRKSTAIDAALSLEGEQKVGPGKGKKQQLTQKQSTGTVVELLKFTPGAQ